MNKEDARALLLERADDIRHHTITKIRVRRKFRDRHTDVSLELLLLSARRDFLAERRLISLLKKKVEGLCGESIGLIEDQDGRLL
jgi:hypothetical protein